MSTRAEKRSWTTRTREIAVGAMPPERLLPDEQPSYVASWIYVFGVLTIAALIMIVLSGVVLALKGPAWWHYTGIGHFINSVHLWAVELFFFVMVVHLWGKYWMAAWRGGRTRTWMTGAVCFLIAVPTAFTGYLSQQNFDAQWIATQAKDGINATGAGAFFNVLNFGQMYSYHILLLPVAVVALVIWHVLLVRRHGVVPPFPVFAAAPGPQSTPPAPQSTLPAPQPPPDPPQPPPAPPQPQAKP
jgi:ubiquinol-cytochrome c reductase cytochrome b subunit